MITAADNPIQRIALLGSPNVGKSSLFNILTGLNQKVGNFPGVTVDKKTGYCRLSAQKKVEVIDLPGVYSLFAKSPDERVVVNVLLDAQNAICPDLVVVVLDAVNLERSIMLFTQVRDLGYPVIPLLNMIDVAEDQGIYIDKTQLSLSLQQPIFEVNARRAIGVTALKKAIANYSNKKQTHNDTMEFRQKLLRTQAPFLDFLSTDEKNRLALDLSTAVSKSLDIQLQDTTSRMSLAQELLEGVIQQSDQPKETFTDRVDRLITHPILGYLIYFGILLGIFQLIFSVADYPMNWIDSAFTALNAWLQSSLPESVLTDLLTEGIITGIGGVLIFIPQIALLFGIIALLEESGYMSRVVF